MATLSSLPNDVLVEILLLAHSPQDLLHAVLISHEFLNAYHHYRATIIQRVICRTVKLKHRSPDRALAFVNRLRARCRSSNNLVDPVYIFKAIQPLMLEGKPSSAQFTWAVELCRLQQAVGENISGLSNTLSLLERLYPAVLTVQKRFELGETRGSSHTSSGCVGRRLRADEKDLCGELCREYANIRQPAKQLEIQSQVFQRLSLKETDSHIWGWKMVQTFRSLHRFEDAIELEMQIYHVCRARGRSYLKPRLTWARHIVSEYTRAGKRSQALEHQKMFFADLIPGSMEHSSWARRLSTMQEHAGLIDDALQTRNIVRHHIRVVHVSSHGWARKSANGNRQLNRMDDDHDVMRTLLEETQQQSSARRTIELTDCIWTTPTKPWTWRVNRK